MTFHPVIIQAKRTHSKKENDNNDKCNILQLLVQHTHTPILYVYSSAFINKWTAKIDSVTNVQAENLFSNNQFSEIGDLKNVPTIIYRLLLRKSKTKAFQNVFKNKNNFNNKPNRISNINGEKTGWEINHVSTNKTKKKKTVRIDKNHSGRSEHGEFSVTMGTEYYNTFKNPIFFFLSIIV